MSGKQIHLNILCLINYITKAKNFSAQLGNLTGLFGWCDECSCIMMLSDAIVRLYIFVMSYLCVLNNYHRV